MNKKAYITPECLVVEIETANMLALSLPHEDKIEEDDSSDMGDNRHRGEWGNLWGRGE